MLPIPAKPPSMLLNLMIGVPSPSTLTPATLLFPQTMQLVILGLLVVLKL